MPEFGRRATPNTQQHPYETDGCGRVYLALVAFRAQFMLSGFKVARLPLIGTGSTRL